MKPRLAFSISVIIHAALIAVLSAVSFARLKPAPPPPGMELELIDAEHSMPLPDPSLAQALPASSPAPAVAGAVTEPVPASPSVQPATELVPQPPAPQPPSPRQIPEPMPKPVPAPVKTLGLGPVADPQPPQALPPRQPTKPALVTAAPQAPASPSVRVAAPVARAHLDTSAIARSISAKAGTAAESRLNSAAIGSAIGRAAPRGAAGLTVRQRMNLEEMIRAQVTPCWNPPTNEDGLAAVTILLRIRLDRSGAVVGTPEVVATRGVNASNAAYGRSLAGSVRRAVTRCAPLHLPPELFDAWSDVELNFDPKDIT